VLRFEFYKRQTAKCRSNKGKAKYTAGENGPSRNTCIVFCIILKQVSYESPSCKSWYTVVVTSNSWYAQAYYQITIATIFITASLNATKKSTRIWPWAPIPPTITPNVKQKHIRPSTLIPGL